jgi:hypothetical protein
MGKTPEVSFLDVPRAKAELAKQLRKSKMLPICSQTGKYDRAEGGSNLLGGYPEAATDAGCVPIGRGGH